MPSKPVRSQIPEGIINLIPDLSVGIAVAGREIVKCASVTVRKDAIAFINNIIDNYGMVRQFYGIANRFR